MKQAGRKVPPPESYFTSLHASPASATDVSREGDAPKHSNMDAGRAHHAANGAEVGGASGSDASLYSSASAVSSGSSEFSPPPMPCSADFGLSQPGPSETVQQARAEAGSQLHKLPWAVQSVESEPHPALSVQDAVAVQQRSLTETRNNWGRQLVRHRESSAGHLRAKASIRVDESVEGETVEGMMVVLAQLTTTPLGMPWERGIATGRSGEDVRQKTQLGANGSDARHSVTSMLSGALATSITPDERCEHGQLLTTDVERGTAHTHNAWSGRGEFISDSDADVVASSDDDIAWPPGIAHLRPPDSPRLTGV